MRTTNGRSSGRARERGRRGRAAARMASDAAGDRAEEPGDLRDRARAPAQDEGDDDQEQRERVDRVHAVDRRTGAGSAAGGSRGQVTDHADGLRAARAVGDRVRARVELTEVDQRPLELGDIRGRSLVRAVALAQRDLERRWPGLHDDRNRGRCTVRRRWCRRPRRRPVRPSPSAESVCAEIGWTSSWPGLGTTRRPPSGRSRSGRRRSRAGRRC